MIGMIQELRLGRVHGSLNLPVIPRSKSFAVELVRRVPEDGRVGSLSVEHCLRCRRSLGARNLEARTSHQL